MTSGRRSKAHRAEGTDRRQRAKKGPLRLVDPTPNWGKPSDDLGVHASWCLTEEDLPEVRAKAHDVLIGMLGDSRTGPVTWHWYQGDEAHKALDQLSAGEASRQPGQDELEHYRRIRGKVREYGGYVIVTTAPAIAAPAPTPEGDS